MEWGIFEQAIHSYSMVMVPFYDQLGEDARKFIMKESKKNSIKKIVMKENWKNSKDKNLLWKKVRKIQFKKMIMKESKKNRIKIYCESK